MGRSGIPGEGTRPRVRHAGQLGWEDTLSGVWWGVGVIVAAAVVSFVSLAGFRTKPPPQPAAQAE